MPCTVPRTRLLLAIPHLGGGGAERVVALLTQHLDPALFEIHLVLLTPDRSGAPTLPPHLTVHRLRCRRVRHAILPLLRLIRTVDPQLILSGMAHLNFLMLLLKPLLPTHTRLLLRQNTTASAASSWLSRFAYRHLYPRAERILCQSQAMADDLVQNFGLTPEKLAVLRNPIVPATFEASAAPPIPASQTPAGPSLLFVGRLSPEKGADLLLHAFAVLRKEYPKATLTLLGEGSEEGSLRELAHSLQIAQAVHFAGYADPARYYAAATLFALPSRYEGMPNALLEAASAGLPIVATPASGGLVSLIQDAPGCWLASRITAPALAQALKSALATLGPLPQRFSHAFLAPFLIQPAIAAYNDLLMAASRPRLAFLIPTIDQIGGAERQVLDLAQELARRHWPVTVVALSGNGGAALAVLRATGVNFLSLGMRKAWIDPRGWFRYLRWRRMAQPEIVHAHLPHATFFARLVRLIAPVPVLVDTIHTSATGSLARCLAYRWTHFLTDRLTCVSRAVQDAVDSVHMAPIRASLLPNGIRIPDLQRRLLYGPAYSGSFCWLAIGRLAPVKDYPTLLRAFALLPSHATLTIGGSGPDEPQLRTLAATLGIISRVHFAGFHGDIQPLLSQADAFVQSSLWEGLPLAILEASAAALPVVATDAAGTRETLVPEQTGFLVPTSQPEALAAAMLHLMEMPADQRRRMANRGRAFVQANFVLSAVVDRWEQLYNQLLRESVLPVHAEPLPVPSPSRSI